MISSVNEPHPSTYMGDPSGTYGTYVWWEYLLEENMILSGTHVQKEMRSQSLKIYHINRVDVRPISLEGQR